MKRRSIIAAAGAGVLSAPAITPVSNGWPPYVLRRSQALASENHGGFLLERVLRTPNDAVAVAFSADGSRIAAASNFGGLLSVWDSEGRLINRFERSGGGPTLGGCIAFSRDGTEILFPPPEALVDRVGLCVWNVQSGQIVRTIPTVPADPKDEILRIDLFALTPDGEALYGSGLANRVVKYAVDTGELLGTILVEKGVSALTVFGNGRWIGVSSYNQSLSRIDASNPTSRVTWPIVPLNSFGSVISGAIAGSSDGERLLCGAEIIGFTQSPVKVPEAKSWGQSVPSTILFDAGQGRLLASNSQPLSPVRFSKWDRNARFAALVDNAGRVFLVFVNEVRMQLIEIASVKSSLSLDIAPDGSRLAVGTPSGVAVIRLIL